MGLDTRGMERREWTDILERRTVISAVSEPGFCGWAGLMRIDAVARPFVRGVTLADAGYEWLQLAPEGEHWWLTVMYDPAGALVQYYFDITLENRLRPTGEPEFVDLYLDVVLRPDGSYTVLDRDELDEALERGEILTEQRDLALAELDGLLARINGREPVWRRLCARVKEKLEKAWSEE